MPGEAPRSHVLVWGEDRLGPNSVAPLDSVGLVKGRAGPVKK